MPQPLNLADQEIISQARQTFSTRTGQATLMWMLGDMGAFDPIPETAEAIALRNWAMKLLAILGGGGIIVENMQAFTMRLMKQPIIDTKGESQ